MLIEFFYTLRKHRVPCTLREFLDLINGLKQGVVFADVEEFYHFSRTVLVKDEVNYDKFDCAFAEYFDGVSKIDIFDTQLPNDWLNNALQKMLSEEEKKQIEALGGLDKLMDTLKQRLEEQKKRHQGGSKWIGTGGTSPFGAYGYNPEGIRIGQDGNRNFKAVKVWDKREFKNLDADEGLGPRNMKLALRKLRKFARVGASEELDLAQTIRSTANNAGFLDVKFRPERHNAINVLMFFDVGGSMDSHVEQCQQLFSAAQSEFKHLEYYYFHNCIYEGVWKDNERRRSDTIAVEEIIRRYGNDYKIIFVGDATMGPYEITYPGGSVEHYNEKPGSYWMQEIVNHFPKVAWLNPQPHAWWGYYHSIGIMKQLIDDRMFAFSLEGIEQAVKSLT